MGRALEGLGGRREGGVSWRGGGGVGPPSASGWKSFQLGRGGSSGQESRGLCSSGRGSQGFRGLREMQGYGEVGKVRGKMDIFWTSLTRPWWKSSKPKISGECHIFPSV